MAKVSKKRVVNKSSRKTPAKKSTPKKPQNSTKSTTPKKKGKGGRPRIDIDWQEFGKLCEMQCTKDEICEWFKVSDSTLSRAVKRRYKASFEDLYKKESVGGKISLRRLQLQSAQKGNITMQIFLGKQYLGQSDKVVNTSQNKGKILEAIEKMVGE
jgi:hypothetical protein